MKFSVNGQEREVAAPDDMPLLWVLRDLLGLTGTKYGCGIGQCGACTVHVDGEPRAFLHDHGRRRWPARRSPPSKACRADAQPPRAARLGRTGRRAVRLLPVRADHVGRGAAGQQPEARRDADIDAALGRQLCRCGTYQRIRAAVHRRRRAAPGGAANERPVPTSTRREFLKTAALSAAGLVIAFVVPLRAPLRPCRRSGAGRAGRCAPATPSCASRPTTRHRAARALRDGPGHLDHAADADRRGTRRRLVEDPRRARAGGAGLCAHRVRHAGDRRLVDDAGPSSTATARSAPRRARCCVQAAAQRLGVAPADCRTENGVVVAGGQRLRYGELAEEAAQAADAGDGRAEGPEGLEDHRQADASASTRRRRSTAARCSASTCSFDGLLTAVVARARSSAAR